MNRGEKQSQVGEGGSTAAAIRFRYIVPDPSRPPSEYLISALVAQRRGGHEHVLLWSRGGLAGELVLGEGDTALLAALHGLAWDECDGDAG